MNDFRDVAEILLSADKFKELFVAIQDCYTNLELSQRKLADVYDSILHVDSVLGTAIKDNAKRKNEIAYLSLLESTVGDRR